MIKKMMYSFAKYRIWILAMLLLNMIFGWLLWLVSGNAFVYLFGTMLLGSVLVYCLIGILIFRRDQKRKEALLDFLYDPSTIEQEMLLKLFSTYDRDLIRAIGELLRDKNDRIREQENAVQEYEEYIETWAHEIKTPLALMTFVLDNRKEEMSATVCHRLEYARTIMQEDVERMLYYARLKSARNDYFFTELSLEEVCNEVLAEYRILLQEKKINVITEYASPHVFSDKKGVQFFVTQVISNAIKYQKSQENGSLIHVSTTIDESARTIRLTIRDNGIGVKPYDLPFVFEKGFTGEIGEQRKNSTGMGLYLAKQVADHLKVEISVSEEYTSGFEITFMFPDALPVGKQ